MEDCTVDLSGFLFLQTILENYRLFMFFFLFSSDSEHVDNTVMDPGLLILCNTFRYPHQVPYLLLSQSHVRKEHRVMELQNIQINAEFWLVTVLHPRKAELETGSSMPLIDFDAFYP